MAVQGDNPRSITPAIYCWLPAKTVFAKNVISGGAITQLAIIVTSNGLGRAAAFLMSLKRIPNDSRIHHEEQKNPYWNGQLPELQ
jgi:hypothetical protein